ncbi:MAG TPA: UDP-N-acetylmuramoyl-L-alanine--D-glutamate ligase [Rhodanobacteraceae bacterium]|jgi:UDP-N-acetylmuramoylalanine--D-glutamate ligase|nr:UDP-N-acetylmuramoyl-L-alanine--D-glutamate ligase [Rhodanobacteraceae bacterium]
MRFAELEPRDVAIWGLGREGRAALAALRKRFPDKPLTLYCKHDEAEAVRALIGANVRAVESVPDSDALASHAIVIKSPGISAYRPELLAAQARGTVFTSGTALWFGENPDARIVAITGTKGKSTTTAMIAHCARTLGIRTALAGNIGMPLLELDGQRADLWAIELSSFQTGEAGPLELGVVVSLEEEHLDWHGSRERYIADKLKLADVSHTLLVNAQAPLLMQHTAAHRRRIVFNNAQRWHVADGAIRRGDSAVVGTNLLPVPGAHNAVNACAALAAIEAMGFDANAAVSALRDFKPLPHRLQKLGQRDGVEWIDDSIATTPAAALAALRSVQGHAVTLILGGFDRGLDWSGFADQLAAHPPHAVIVQGASAPRIVEALRSAKTGCRIARCEDLPEAVMRAKELTAAGGVVVLSPGAPSFDQFRDYAQRGRAFAALAGFDAAALGEIEGLGII